MQLVHWRVLRIKVLGELVDVLHRGLTEDPPARVALMRLKWTPHAQAPKSRPRMYPPERRQCLSQQTREWSGRSWRTATRRRCFSSWWVITPSTSSWRRCWPGPVLCVLSHQGLARGLCERRCRGGVRHDELLLIVFFGGQSVQGRAATVSDRVN